MNQNICNQPPDLFPFLLHSLVLLWSHWILHLYYHSTYSPHRLCPLVEQAVGGKRWEREQKMLVCRYSVDVTLVFPISALTWCHNWDAAALTSFLLCCVDVICRPAVLHHSLLCTGFSCCGAFLHLLYKAWWLYGAQSLHQPQPHLLHHHLCGLHFTQSPGGAHAVFDSLPK